MEFVIIEFSGLDIAPDQVHSWSKAQGRVVHEGPQASSDAISCNGVTHFAADRERHSDRLVLCWPLDETYPEGPASSSSGGVSELRKLPAGTDPSGHTDSDRQLVTALVAARLQYRAARSSAHARPKTVGFSPFTLIWLIRSLHENLSSKQSEGRTTPPGGQCFAAAQSLPLAGIPSGESLRKRVWLRILSRNVMRTGNRRLWKKW